MRHCSRYKWTSELTPSVLPCDGSRSPDEQTAIKKPEHAKSEILAMTMLLLTRNNKPRNDQQQTYYRVPEQGRWQLLHSQCRRGVVWEQEACCDRRRRGVGAGSRPENSTTAVLSEILELCLLSEKEYCWVDPGWCKHIIIYTGGNNTKILITDGWMSLLCKFSVGFIFGREGPRKQRLFQKWKLLVALFVVVVAPQHALFCRHSVRYVYHIIIRGIYLASYCYDIILYFLRRHDECIRLFQDNCNRQYYS